MRDYTSEPAIVYADYAVTVAAIPSLNNWPFDHHCQPNATEHFHAWFKNPALEDPIADRLAHIYTVWPCSDQQRK